MGVVVLLKVYNDFKFLYDGVFNEMWLNGQV